MTADDWRARPRAALAAGETVLGTFVKSPDPQVAEILANAGFGLLVADLEHSALEVRDVATIVRAAEPHEVGVLARIGPAELHLAGRLLEAGAVGIQLTGVEDAATLRELRHVTRFPPPGARSLALSHRAAGYGRTSAAAFVAQEHARLLTVAQIETRAGVEALPSLLGDEDAADVWFIGPLDLSVDLGHPGELEHPHVVAAIDRMLAAMQSAHVGVFARDAADARNWRSRGAQLILVSSDVALLAGAARDAARALD